MPMPLPPKARAKTLPARKRDITDSIDWLGLWAISLGFCAINLAAIAYFQIGDNIGACFILAGAAALISGIICFGSGRNKARQIDK